MNKQEKDIKNGGFKIPQGYFNTFEERLMQNQMLSGISSTKENGFKVPPAYFENFDVRLEDKLEDKKVVKLWYQDRRAAACFLSAVAAVFIAFLFLWNPEKENTLDNLSSTALSDYLIHEGIQELLSEEDLSTIEDNSTLFQSFTMSDDLLFEMIDEQLYDAEFAQNLSGQ
ncbi:hypothetical protein [Flavimarina sp. Hel_I_48]|uniref:hypothetical protein n=1 Tax=Flavimarina sp. Hel_I_48 TaxID=1392488 RepID=UPI00068A76F7|nr:hypothetical protein [Flavimarina sp. Hel_I_48]